MSRASSVSNLRGRSSSPLSRSPSNGQRPSISEREVFRWSELHTITNQVFSKASQKASSVLGKATFSTPTVIASNGMICLGLEDGRVLVYDFKQTLKAICGNESIGKTMGPVTALALSHDHTCVATGHANGHIQLYDLRKPTSPIRSVSPTTLDVVATGRKEGHLQGSRIVSIGFIAGRHTALVSADEHGLAFYHSLGKMLFVEAADILRILGQYPEPIPPPEALQSPPSAPLTANRKVRYVVLSMAPLPLGTNPHPTDAYNVVALLTPTKLVVVGLKPTPKTWFKIPREPEEGRLSKSRMKGTLAWFPSVARPSPNGPTGNQAVSVKQKDGTVEQGTEPILAYSWGNSLRIIKVVEARFKQRVMSLKTGKTNEIDIGTIGYEVVGRYMAEETITAMQWLHANQIVLVTRSSMVVYDIQLSRILEHAKFDGLALMSPTLDRTANGSVSYSDAAADTAHSLRVYKGKMFLLARDRVLVGTMLTWADRILSLVEAGDFLGAIELCRTYYTNEAPGNRNGLPDDPELRQTVIGDKLRSLMVASATYAFSEDRLTDETHRTPGGVDRTPLFEGLVSTCCRAAIALDDFYFLFEDLFQLYDDSGIATIYLRQLEPFILDNEIRYVPPRITQRLIALHEVDGHPEYVERIIWHMDPACLDLNQTIQLCQKFRLYDALIYIYTRALQDYVAPVVELLGLIRRIYQLWRTESLGLENPNPSDDESPDSLAQNAYKIYPYLANILSGLSFPSEEPLPEDEANTAKKSLYSFLFFGRSNVWPPGNDGKLVLTAIEEGGVEPTYPYARQLLRFDSEAFLHSLDIAFEDSFLNDESRNVNRLIIVRILLEIMSDEELTTEDVTLVNIFIARNVPKYPQFLPIAPTILHNVLIGLAEDLDPKTREDRQLAAEYLLSVYNPHDSEQIISLFEEAGFYRILRTWYRQDRQWPSLFLTYVNDHSLHPADLFTNIDTTLKSAARHNHRSLPTEVSQVLTDSLPTLLRMGISSTAALLDLHAPQMHEETLSVIANEFHEDVEEAKFMYLKQLFVDSGDTEIPFTKRAIDPSRLPHAMLRTFIDLQTRLAPTDVVDVLKQLDSSNAISDWSEVTDICEENEAWDTVIWALNWKKEPQAALRKSESYHQQLTRRVIRSLSSQAAIARELALLKAIGITGRDICLGHSQSLEPSEVPLEDMWFGLLSSQIHAVQSVSSSGLDIEGEQLQGVLTQLRALVQTTFTALVSITSTEAVSFPRLFKRLVDATPTATGTHYTEFRLILGGMLESYRSDADMLNITKHLVERDLFENISRYTVAKRKGWAPSSGTCTVCRRPLLPSFSTKGKSTQPVQISLSEIVVSRTGSITHKECIEAAVPVSS
ncbi:lateendosome to vacuole transport-family protein [Coprinopsis cinerea okayama7|uniref:Lateendosome to vacuole transport-family protein n=1 Tax=Coprinopsis cinerea (strain Okayama-7 / 130 / ATCC MYA-4618 / FGSC 9003) TaxID=240176 RepID=A8N6Z3_COPC7|nr:lateendosome to vacuole transport-family protein [Coprinopsis cinerea okayama7\|eukprot:XP_001830599.2 lateendosome to vacuole transport-family protein [Coprinopsis cinerea okayama7\